MTDTRTITVEALEAALRSENEQSRVWNSERFGYDTTGNCTECGVPVTYFVDEDGTPRDETPHAAAIFAALPAEPAGAGLREALVRVHAEIDEDTNSQRWRDGGHWALELLERELLLPALAATPVGEDTP